MPLLPCSWQATGKALPALPGDTLQSQPWGAAAPEEP